MFRRFIEKHPYFFDQFRRIAGKVALGALLLYGCGLLIVWGLRMGPLSPVMFLFVLWLLIEFVPDLLLPEKFLKGRRSLFDNSDEGTLTPRQLTWKIVFAVATIYVCAVILIAGYTSKMLSEFFLSLVIAVPILVVQLFHLIRAIRRYLAAKNKKVPLDEAAQRELTRLEELYRSGIYSKEEFSEKKARILDEAAGKTARKIH